MLSNSWPSELIEVRHFVAYQILTKTSKLPKTSNLLESGSNSVQSGEQWPCEIAGYGSLLPLLHKKSGLQQVIFIMLVMIFNKGFL